MIKVTIYKNSKGDYTGFKTLGHAGYADSGYDIICSAISILVINTINSIEKFTNDKLKINTDEEKGLIEAEFTSEISQKSTLLMDSLVLGLQGVESNYDNEYIKVVFKEV